MKRIGTLALVCAVLACVQAAEAAVEQGAAKHTPWSGYWWPIARGELLEGPLPKYDYLTGANSVQWERGAHPPGPNVPQWHGYCHAWAASAILEKEPNRPKTARAPGGSRALTLTIGDQKGLFAISHAQDVANHYGDRFGDGAGSEDPHDLEPCMLWEILRTHIKQQKVALVMDLEPGPEVWNYPVYAYRIKYSPSGGGWQNAQLALWAADDAVPPDHVGTSVHYQTYNFRFRLYNGSVVMGSGQWVGQSLQSHPDFAWYPYVVRPENPHVNYQRVKQIVGVPSSGAGSSTPSGTSTRPSTRPSTGTSTRPNTGTSTRPSTGTSTSVRPNVLPGTRPGSRPNVSPGGATIVLPGTGPGVTPGGVPGPFGPGVMPGGMAPPSATWLSPLEVVAAIANKTSSFGLDVSVDRFDGGQYAVGEPLQVRGSSEQAGYLYLFYIDSQGQLGLLYPRAGEDNRIAAQGQFAVPSPEGGTILRASAPVGVHRIKALVTNRPLLLTGMVTQTQSQQQTVVPKPKKSSYRPSQFRSYPAQRKQVQTLLRRYMQQKLSTKDLDGFDVQALLDRFAQDEVAFYVGPAGS